MRFLGVSYEGLMAMPDGYDEIAIQISREERAEQERRRKR